MSIDSHIQQLQQKHISLENELSTLVSSPSVSDLKIAQLKREKLRLKDEIARLQSSVH